VEFNEMEGKWNNLAEENLQHDEFESEFIPIEITFSRLGEDQLPKLQSYGKFHITVHAIDYEECCQDPNCPNLCFASNEEHHFEDSVDKRFVNDFFFDGTETIRDEKPQAWIKPS
jgi:hypothetical protein